MHRIAGSGWKPEAQNRVAWRALGESYVPMYVQQLTKIGE